MLTPQQIRENQLLEEENRILELMQTAIDKYNQSLENSPLIARYLITEINYAHQKYYSWFQTYQNDPYFYNKEYDNYTLKKWSDWHTETPEIQMADNPPEILPFNIWFSSIYYDEFPMPGIGFDLQDFISIYPFMSSYIYTHVRDKSKFKPSYYYQVHPENITAENFEINEIVSIYFVPYFYKILENQLQLAGRSTAELKLEDFIVIYNEQRQIDLNNILKMFEATHELIEINTQNIAENENQININTQKIEINSQNITTLDDRITNVAESVSALTVAFQEREEISLFDTIVNIATSVLPAGSLINRVITEGIEIKTTADIVIACIDKIKSGDFKLSDLNDVIEISKNTVLPSNITESINNITLDVNNYITGNNLFDGYKTLDLNLNTINEFNINNVNDTTEFLTGDTDLLTGNEAMLNETKNFKEGADIMDFSLDTIIDVVTDTGTKLVADVTSDAQKIYDDNVDVAKAVLGVPLEPSPAVTTTTTTENAVEPIVPTKAITIGTGTTFPLLIVAAVFLYMTMKKRG